MRSLEHLAPLAPAVHEVARRWGRALLDLCFPPFCPVCQARLGQGRRDPLCGRCWGALERIGPPWCRCCGAPFPGFPPDPPVPPGRPGHLCGACRRRRPRFDWARAAARYGDAARAAIHAFKFGGRRALAAPLGDLLAAIAPEEPPGGPPEILVAVPLHARRERERGFNQSLLLARRLGRAWSLPVRADVLVRTAVTAPQTDLSPAERRANVRGAFAVRRPEVIAGRRVGLVDDVLTTGATAGECAARLRAAGATAVGVLTVARTV